MGRITVGYQDGCLHPLWLTNTGLRMASLFGASSLWVPDHFMGFIPAHVWNPEQTDAARVVHSPDGLFDPMQILAITAAKTRRPDLGTAVTEPLRRHPMALAQSFVTLDHISKGRAILGIGNGERENVEPYGLPWNRQVSRLDEALDIIRILWASKGEPVHYDGKFWKLKDAIFNLPLYQGREPRIWVASHAPRMLGLTGKYGDGWLPTLKAPPEEYGRRLQVIRDAGEAAGRNMGSFVPGQMILTAMGRSRDEVIEMAMSRRIGAAMSLLAPGSVWKESGKVHPLGEDFTGFYDIVPPRVTPEHVDEAAENLTPEILLSSLYAGTPEEIAAEIAPLADAGARHIVISNVGAAVTNAGPGDMLRLRSLIRKLKAL